MIQATFEKAQQDLELNKSSSVLSIPVVFHVIYNNDEQNLSDDLIQEQIDILNEDFRRLNENAQDTRDIFLPFAADPEIEFYLAEEDPFGDPTSGITRTFSDKTTFVDIDFNNLLEAIQDCGSDLTDPAVLECITEALGLESLDLDAMKFYASSGRDAWDTDRYLNIWSCNLGLDVLGMPLPFILGFAYPPIEAPNWPVETFPEDLELKEGVVLHYQVVGRSNPNSGTLAGLNDQGRTCVHEVGHYLGLRHIWGDGDCSMDDGIADTPPMAISSSPTGPTTDCTLNHDKDSCTDDMLPDMVENYMDYNIESCQNMFTKEQVDLMRSMLMGPRRGLIENTISSVNNVTSTNLQVHPNPTNGLVHLGEIPAENSIQIFDAAGHLVYDKRNTSGKIDLNHLKDGIYFLTLSTKTEHFSSKILLAKVD